MKQTNSYRQGKTSNVVFLASAFFIFLFFFSFVSAQELTASQNPNVLEVFFNNLLHYNQQFSVVGDTRICGASGGQPNFEWSVAAGKKLNGNDGILSGNVGSCSVEGLYDVFTNGWTAYAEFKSVSSWTCGTGPCNVQLYCCPKAEPTSQSSCTATQSFTIMECPNSITKVGGTFYWCKNPSGSLETGIPYYTNSYNYCKNVGSTTKTCYYRDGGSCSTRDYSISNFPNACNTYTYQGAPLFNTLSSCQSSLGSCTSNFECSSGKTCQSGTCVTSTSCTPSSACAANTCTGQTCSDGCDGNVQGTKDCSMPNPTPNVNDPDIPVTIISMSYGNPDGTQLTGPIQPGQQIKINFKIKADNPAVWNSRNYVLEAGVLPQSTTLSWFPSTDASSGIGQSYSVFSPFAVLQTSNNVCCNGQPNINSITVSAGVQPSDYASWTFNHQNIDTSIYEGSVNVQIPASSTTDVCPVNGQSSIYWNGSNNVYGVYFLVANDCAFKEGTSTGFKKQKWLIKEIIVNTGANQTSNVGSSCKDDIDCGIGESCKSVGGISGFFGSKTCQGGGTTGGNSLIDLKKLALTREQIAKATNDDLFSSSCLSSSECLRTTKTNENYSVSCVTISSLRNDGTLTQVKSDSFFAHSNQILNGALTGAGIGLGLGVVACVGGNVLTTTGVLAEVGIPLAVIGCPALLTGGTTAGGAIVGASLANAIQPSDELVKKLKASDANSVGICTAEPNSGFDLTGYIEKAAFFKITGNKTTDGLIIIFGIVLILSFVLRRGK